MLFKRVNMLVEVSRETLKGPWGLVKRRAQEASVEKGQIAEFNIKDGYKVTVWNVPEADGGGLEFISTSGPVSVEFCAESFRSCPKVIQELTSESPSIRTDRRKIIIYPKGRGRERLIFQDSLFVLSTVDSARALELTYRLVQRQPCQ